MAQKRYYTAKNGKKYLVKEAPHDMSFKMYKSDRRIAIQGDGHQCILALGICRNPAVEECYIGSGGDAYILFKATDDDPAFCWHFRVLAEAMGVINSFDPPGGKRRAPSKYHRTMNITLSKPAKSHTIAYRDASNKRRRAEIAAGSPVKRRDTPAKDRVIKLGIRHRKRAPVSFSKDLELTSKASE